MAKKFYKKSEVKFVAHPDHWRFIDLTGHKYGRLTVLGYAGKAANGRTTWFCKCTCKKIIVATATIMRSGLTQSCGCLRIETTKKRCTLHGMSQTYEHAAYRSAYGRCNNHNDAGYKHYGGRGIQFKYRSFNEFYEDLGPRPSPRHSLDRRKNDGHYEAGNCRWVRARKQQNNKSSNNLVTYKRKTSTLAELCEGSHNKLYKTTHNRLMLGWCVTCAFENGFRVSCPHR